MTMQRARLKQYAEFGVRERLREIQRELDTLRAEFPHLVENADGSMPSVLPIVQKKGRPVAAATLVEAVREARTPTTKKKRRRAKRMPIAARRERARAYLAEHPGATASEVALGVGYTSKNGSNGFRIQILNPIASPSGKKVPGRNVPARWFLRGQNGANGAKARATTNGNGRPGARDRARGFLDEHPGSTTAEILAGLGLKPSGTFAEKVLKPIAKHTGPRPVRWFLRGRPAARAFVRASANQANGGGKSSPQNGAAKNGHNGLGRGGFVIKASDRIEPARAFLAEHPGATIREVAKHFGLKVPTATLRSKVLAVIAQPQKVEGGDPKLPGWFLK